MPSPTLTGRDRLEAQLTLALLPVGVILTAAALIGGIAAIAFGVKALATGQTEDGALPLWGLFGAAVAVRNLIGSLKALSAFSWHGHLVTLLWSAVVVASYPGWWIA